MFTKKQIEEIAAKLADLAIKDSQFGNMTMPLNGSENVPILQDNENKLLSFAELVSIVRESDESQLVNLTLKVSCSTPGATIKIDGEIKSSCTVSYGTMVDVEVSATDYVTWFGTITVTRSHSISITLSKAGSGSGGGGSDGHCCCGDHCVCWDDADDDPSTTTYTVTVTNPSGGATLMINDSAAAMNKAHVFNAGDRVVIDITKEGYYQYSKTIDPINRSYTINADEVLEPIDQEEDKHLSFTIPEINIPAESNLTAYSAVDASSYISWQIRSTSLPDYEEDTPGQDTVEPAISVSPETISMTVGETTNITIKA